MPIGQRASPTELFDTLHSTFCSYRVIVAHAVPIVFFKGNTFKGGYVHAVGNTIVTTRSTELCTPLIPSKGSIIMRMLPSRQQALNNLEGVPVACMPLTCFLSSAQYCRNRGSDNLCSQLSLFAA